MNKSFKQAAFLLCLSSLFLIQFACKNEIAVGPSPEDFTKEMRTDLGKKIVTAIANSSEFTLLPNTAPYDSTYWYLQTLYDQAHSLLKADRSSSVVDRWEQTRAWKIHILEDDGQKNAFAVPGGDVYLTTGLLKNIHKSYELYYILSFEASLMNDRHLLNRLITEYGALPLVDLINQPFSTDNTTAKIIGEQIGSLDFDLENIVATDKTTMNQICETSVYDQKGIMTILDQMEDAKWLEHKSFGGRKNIVAELMAEHAERCGELRTDGKYGKYVLERLP